MSSLFPNTKDVMQRYLSTARVDIMEIVTYLGVTVAADADLSGLRAALDAAREQHGGYKFLEPALGLNEQELKKFMAAVRRLVKIADKSATVEMKGVAGQIAALQVLDFIDRMKEANPKLPVRLSEQNLADHDLEKALKQVRALELIIRSLIQDAYRTEQALVNHLIARDGHEKVQAWLKVADSNDILSGTMFRELTELFLDAKEYAAHYAGLFSDTPFLNLLADKRDTLQAYLLDIRGIRNRLAHHKRVTPVQTALIDAYFQEVVTPVQDAFDDGRTGVNPDVYLDATKEQLDAFMNTLSQRLDDMGEDVTAIRESTGRIEVGLTGLKTTTDATAVNVDSLVEKATWSQKNLRWLLMGGAGVLVIGVVTLSTASRTLTSTGNIEKGVAVVSTKVDKVKRETSDDPRKELANLGVAWNEQSMSEAIESGDAKTVQLFLDGGMHWEPAAVYSALDHKDSRMPALLFAHGDLVAVHDNNCDAIGRHLMRQDPAPPGVVIADKDEHAHQFTADERTFLKVVCHAPADVAMLKSEYEGRLKNHEDALSSYKTALAKMKTPAQCEADLLRNNAAELREDPRSWRSFDPMFRPTKFSQLHLDIGYADEKTLTPQFVREKVHAYCQDQETPNISISPAFMESAKQAYEAAR